MRYGRVNFEYATDMGTREPSQDGPIFMVNLMKYRAQADYQGEAGAAEAISGKEADDRYAPVDVLEKIGATVAFFGDVVSQSSLDEWDRVGIVKYASRRSFIEMQSRRDFQDKHVHKEAGMDYTICLGALPRLGTPTRSKYCTLHLTSSEQGLTLNDFQSVFSVEGTVLGDGRVWTDLSMTWSSDLPAVTARDRGGDTITVVVEPTIDRFSKFLGSFSEG
jgi:hypothetical protein